MSEHKHCFVEAGGLYYCDCGASPPLEFWERLKAEEAARSQVPQPGDRA